MGYRHYFYLVKQENIEKVNLYRETDIKLLREEDEFFSIIDYMKGIEVFEFGKWYDHAAEIIGTGIPLFVRQETQRIFSDYQPYIIDKRGLNISIDLMRRQILANIEEDLTLDDDVLLLRKRQKAEMKKFDFKRLPDLDNDKYSLTDSCYFEYTIFNLIHIYKTVDWDKNRLIFIGY